MENGNPEKYFADLKKKVKKTLAFFVIIWFYIQALGLAHVVK